MAVDDYFAKLTDDKRKALTRVRRLIRTLAPGAEECISYGMPAFRLHGKTIAWYGASAKHLALYGVTAGFEEELEDYDTSGRGTIRFTPDEPLPDALLRRLVKGRIARTGAKHKKKG